MYIIMTLYTSTMIQFFWKEDTMVSYVRDQHYTIVDMLGKITLIILIHPYFSILLLIVANFGGVVLSDGNLQVDEGSSGESHNVTSTFGMTSGKFYCLLQSPPFSQLLS